MRQALDAPPRPYTTLFRSKPPNLAVSSIGEPELQARPILPLPQAANPCRMGVAPINFNGSSQHRKAGLVEISHRDRKSTRLNSSHVSISYAVFRLKKKNAK